MRLPPSCGVQMSGVRRGAIIDVLWQVGVSAQAANVLGRDVPGLVLELNCSLRQREAFQMEPRVTLPDHSTAGGSSRGGFLTCVSMKLSRTPRLHSRLLFRQLRQSGKPSSHFRCRSLHVRHPVRTRFDLVGGVVPAAATAPLLSGDAQRRSRTGVSD